jgi:hypothetical protein
MATRQSEISEPIVWIDLTDLRFWKGHLTGIQRVVLNVAESFSHRGGARYFAYDFARRGLFEVPFDVSDFQAPYEGVASWNARAARSVAVRVATRRHRRGVPSSWLRARGEWRPAAFGDGDSLLLLGNVWDQPGLQDSIQRLKDSRPIRVFHLVYDLIPVLAPHWSEPTLPARYAEYLTKAAALSDELFAISQATALDLARFGVANRVTLPPVTVIRLGDEVPAGGEPEAPPEMWAQRPFVLTVGALEARKNHALLYAVWKLAHERGIVLPTLVIVGARGFGADDSVRALANDPTLRERVLILSDVGDGGLRWLYENCRFTIYPSIYEGWGLPIAESLHHGKLCLASGSSSMPEIAGDLVEYFSPFDAAECLALAARYMDDRLLRDREARITSEYRGQSWSQTARQLDARLRGAR